MTNARIQSYRLGQRDEREVRWALGLDLKGDVGIKSTFGAFLNQMNLRGNLERWAEKTPPRKRNNYYVDLRDHDGQCVEIGYGHDHQWAKLTYEMSEELTSAGSKFAHVSTAICALTEQQWFALGVRYGRRSGHDLERDDDSGKVANSGEVVGLEPFHDLGTLAGFTDTAQKAWARRDVIAGLRLISATISADPADVDPLRADADLELFETIYAEADAMLSGACRVYVAASKEALRSETVARLMRSKR